MGMGAERPPASSTIPVVSKVSNHPRRAAGTRTMFDVLRHLFRPPTAEQKAADVTTVTSGGELVVSCWLIPPPTGKRLRVYTHGDLHVFSDRVEFRARKGPHLSIGRDEWVTAPFPDGQPIGKYAHLSLVNRDDPRRHQELRVPSPDVDLIRTVIPGR